MMSYGQRWWAHDKNDENFPIERKSRVVKVDIIMKPHKCWKKWLGRKTILNEEKKPGKKMAMFLYVGDGSKSRPFSYTNKMCHIWAVLFLESYDLRV